MVGHPVLDVLIVLHYLVQRRLLVHLVFSFVRFWFLCSLVVVDAGDTANRQAEAYNDIDPTARAGQGAFTN
jgi:hypothetical protein